VLEDTRGSPPSLKEVVKELNSTTGYVWYHFQEECQEISQRYMAYVENQANVRRKQRAEKVKSIIVMLHEHGVYPSRNRVAMYLKSKGDFKNKVIQQVYTQTMQELGLKY
jgi:hypothetical protein